MWHGGERPWILYTSIHVGAHSHVTYSFVGLVVKASASRAEDPGFESHLRRNFPGSSHTVTSKLALMWLPCQAPGVILSVLRMVGPVSVYCDWVR